MKKNVVAGLGEIGRPIQKLLAKYHPCMGYDTDPSLVNPTQIKKLQDIPTEILHVCIPFNKRFAPNIVSLTRKFDPELVVVHSTVPPNTTTKLQSRLSVPVIYSATRGTHKRMMKDLKRYTKCYALSPRAPRRRWAASACERLMRKCKIKTRAYSNPVTLELAKIVVDTTYAGWLISFAQISNMIARKYGVDYDEMWTFADEIQKYVGVAPKMFPGFIGGHCIIPNLSLIDEKDFWQIDRINNTYAKKVKNAKTIYKKYGYGEQSHSG